ncbi:hypothetical protein [Flavobacterium poyangense]|uniref:hypothetical protein n=1 Tax=Flavobacterium poyangense TaxID=2204302 RepID=UPI001423C655|nr:hypothetical protein [Flavobacterium sp. JXAS1]
MYTKTIMLFLFPLTSCLAQDLNFRYKDTLALFEKDLIQCIKEQSDHENDCRKQYYHVLQDYETDVYYHISNKIKKNKTSVQKEAMDLAEGEWKKSSYWYIAKLMKEFKEKHPGKNVWDADPKLKPDIKLFYIKTAAFFTDRINYLLNLVKD